MKNYILVFLVLLSSHAFSGERIGNGGDILICNQRYSLLDYHEAYRNGYSDFLNGTSVRDITNKAINRLKTLDPILAYDVDHIAQIMLADIEAYQDNCKVNQLNTLFTKDKLIDVDDSMETSLPVSCIKQQLVINNLKVLSLNKIFYIQQRYWDRLSNDQKAYTVLHEGIYMSLIRRGSTDSRLARYLNGILISDAFEKYSLQDYERDIAIEKQSQ